MKVHVTVSILVLALALPLTAQDTEVARLREASPTIAFGSRPAASPFSLLDFSKMRWSHSYSISFLSGTDGSGSVGLLNTTMAYEFSSKLSMTLNLGILHNTGAIWGDAGNDATLLPSLSLDFHPSDKFSLSIGVERRTGFLTPYYWRGSRYWYGNPFYPY